jgi:hypothetical protein
MIPILLIIAAVLLWTLSYGAAMNWQETGDDKYATWLWLFGIASLGCAFGAGVKL